MQFVCNKHKIFDDAYRIKLEREEHAQLLENLTQKLRHQSQFTL